MCVKGGLDINEGGDNIYLDLVMGILDLGSHGFTSSFQGKEIIKGVVNHLHPLSLFHTIQTIENH